MTLTPVAHAVPRVLDEARLQDIVCRVIATAIAEQTREPVAPDPAPPTPELPAWMSVGTYARYVGKAPKTVRGWARRAPEELVQKYGREWRLSGPAFDAWVRRGGPFRPDVIQTKDEERQVH